MGLQVPAGCHDALDLSVKRGLFLSEFEQLLRVPHRDFLLKRNLLLNLLLLGLSVLVGLLGNRLRVLKLFSKLHLILQLYLERLELSLLILQSLLLLEKFLVLDADVVPEAGPVGGEGGELILEDVYFSFEVSDGLCFKVFVFVLLLADIAIA